MTVDPDDLKTLENCKFEECLQKLENIVNEMESGNVPLEDLIAKFEEGTAIATVCHKKLALLKQKIEMLQAGRENAASATAENQPENPSEEN